MFHNLSITGIRPVQAIEIRDVSKQFGTHLAVSGLSLDLPEGSMMLILLAYLGSFVVMRAPDSGLAVGLSLIPTMTPFAMMLRIVMPPGPPLWQVLLSVTLLAATTAAVVWAAGRIFRVGLLMQGKPPNLPELLKWIGR
jgi:ABC-type Na+ efflux pump permease subunit